VRAARKSADLFSFLCVSVVNNFCYYPDAVPAAERTAMKNRFALPPMIAEAEAAEAAYLAERSRAQSEKILASMEVRLDGRPNAGRRHVLGGRPSTTTSRATAWRSRR